MSGGECPNYNGPEVILHPLQPMGNKIGNDEVTIKIEVDDHDYNSSTATGWWPKLQYILGGRT